MIKIKDKGLSLNICMCDRNRLVAWLCEENDYKQAWRVIKFCIQLNENKIMI